MFTVDVDYYLGTQPCVFLQMWITFWGPMLVFFLGKVQTYYYVAMLFVAILSCYNVIMLHCYSVAMLLCCNVIMLQCFYVAMLLCCNVIRLQCYYVAMLFCCNVVMLQ